MSSVQFEEDNVVAILLRHPDNAYKGLTGLVMKTGFIKNEKQASFLLVGIIFLCIGIIAFIIFSSSTTDKSKRVSPTKIERIMNLTK